MSLPVLIPVNRLDRSKGRLSDILDPGEREALTLITLQTVLAAVEAAGMEPVVLAADPAVAAHLGQRVLVLTEDPALTGLNPQLEAALQGLAAPAVLVLHADLPLVRPGSLQQLAAAAVEHGTVAIVRSADGGTNAMLLRPPGRFALAYGRASFDLHVAAANRAGMRLVVVEAPDIALDLDTAADLRALLSTDEGRASPAGRFLISRDVEDRLGSPDV